jgi:hypothetical protein
MFKVGDKVTWESQAGGCTRTKTGNVVAIVQPGVNPGKLHFLKAAGVGTLSRRFDGWPRKAISYLVAVRPGKTEKSSPVLYWPLASKLKAV